MNEQRARAVVAESLAALQQSIERLGLALAVLFEQQSIWPEEVEAFYRALAVAKTCLAEALEHCGIDAGEGLEAVVLPQKGRSER